MSPNKPVLIRTKRWAIVLAVVGAMALPVAAWFMGSRVDDNCESIHKIVEAGVKILDSPTNLKRAYDKHLITRAEYESSLTQIHRFDPLREDNVRVWRSADCEQ